MTMNHTLATFKSGLQKRVKDVEGRFDGIAKETTETNIHFLHARENPTTITAIESHNH
jgi:hypothetical protein